MKRHRASTRTNWRLGLAGVALALMSLGPAARAMPSGPYAGFFVHPAGGARVVAHRGGAKLAPENTLAAYRAAVERGDRAAECDVHLSADGELVVIHDATLARTTDGHGAVARTPWSKLRRLDAGAWKNLRFRGEPLPRLDEVLDLVRGKMVLFIELKRGEGLVEKVAEAIDARPEQREQLIIISFDSKMISEASKRLPDIPRMLLMRSAAGSNEKIVRRARRKGATMLGVHSGALSAGLIREAHRKRLPVYAFTVNSPRRAEQLVELGVDGIITDAPPTIDASLVAGAPSTGPG